MNEFLARDKCLKPNGRDISIILDLRERGEPVDVYPTNHHAESSALKKNFFPTIARRQCSFGYIWIVSTSCPNTNGELLPLISLIGSSRRLGLRPVMGSSPTPHSGNTNNLW